MCLKEIANKNTAWNSVQYHLFYQLDRCQKIQKSNFGNVQDKWIYSGWKNRCRQQTALYTGDWINGLHYNHMYTDLKKVLGINIAFVKHYHIILKIKNKKKKSVLKLPFAKDRCTFISKYSYQTLSENLKGLKCGSCEQLVLIWHLDSIWTWHKSHKSI